MVNVIEFGCEIIVFSKGEWKKMIIVGVVGMSSFIVFIVVMVVLMVSLIK